MSEENDLWRMIQGHFERLRSQIPPMFHRTFEQRPFGACDFCYQPLLEPAAQYVIMKFHAGEELKQEIAICFACGKNLQSQYSRESRQALKKLIPESLLASRAERALEIPQDRALHFTAECMLCQTPKQDATENITYAYCEGPEILYFVPPFMVCSDCTIQIYDQLSDKTREVERGFWTDHLGLPPDFGDARPLPRPEEMPRGVLFG